MVGTRGGGSKSSDPRYRNTLADAAEDFLFHLYRGSELLQENRVHDAKSELEEALRLQPRDAKGQDLLAIVYFRLGLYPRAIEIYEELTRAFPREAALSQNLALCYLKTAQFERARALLEPLVMAEPNHVRAWAYLGLVYERLVDYEKARAAYERAGQPGKARRMTERLAPSAAANFSSHLPEDAEWAASSSLAEFEPSPTLSERALRRSSMPSEDAHPDRMPPPPVTLQSFPPVHIDATPEAEEDHDADRDSEASSGAVAHAAGEGSREPLPWTMVAEATRWRGCVTQRPNASDVPSVVELARERVLLFPRNPGVSLHPSGLVLVQVEGSFHVRGSAIRAMSGEGEGFQSSPLPKKVRGKATAEPLGGAADPLLLFSGWGHLVLAARHEHRLTALRLEDDSLYLHERNLVGFESGLAYESGRLAGNGGRHLAVVQLRGRGAVVFETRRALACLDVASDRTSIVEEQAIVGWTGRLLARELETDEAVGSSTRHFAFCGDGTVFLSTATLGSERRTP